MVKIEEHGASLFVLYLLLSGGFLAPLLSCKSQAFLNSSMTLKHFLGFLTMTFFVVLANQASPLPITELFSISGALYIWFIASTRMNIYTWLLFIICVGGLYVIHVYHESISSKDKKTPEEKATLEKIKTGRQVLAYSAIALTIFGVFLYFGEKRYEYGDKFDLIKFIFGKPECRGKTPSIGILDTIRSVFVGRA